MPNTYYIQDDGTIDRMETHPQNPLPPTLQQRLEAAEAEAAALRAENYVLNAANQVVFSTLADTCEKLESAEAEVAALREQLATVTQERNDWELNARCCHIERDKLRKRLDSVTADRDSLKRTISEAFNSGDGTYRP